MNSKERVRLAFARREADRVPVLELTVDNPTAAYVLGRPTLCGFGGRVRGLLQNQALMAGTIDQYRRQRTQDEIDLWQALDLDVFIHMVDRNLTGGFNGNGFCPKNIRKENQ